MIRRPPRTTLLPDTTLFPALGGHFLELGVLEHAREHVELRPEPPHLTRSGGAGLDLGIIPREAHELVRSEVRCRDRKSTRLNSSHANISYAVFCLKKIIPTH